MVGIGVGGESRRNSEDEAGGIGRRQHHALVAARLVTGGECVCVYGLLELIAKAMTPHPSGSGRCIGYEWARH
jgi:hypothetical protein